MFSFLSKQTQLAIRHQILLFMNFRIYGSVNWFTFRLAKTCYSRKTTGMLNGKKIKRYDAESKVKTVELNLA